MSENERQHNLSPTMREALDYAYYLRSMSYNRRIESARHLSGWFYAQFTTRGSIDFFCRPQTLEALYRRGLLERRITCYGDGTEFKQYRAPLPEDQQGASL